MATSDQEINRGVRGVLSRHWVDLTATNFASRQGVVRLMGELRRIGPRCEESLESTNIVALDAELRRLRGVRRVHLDLSNWRRDEEGAWVPVAREATVEDAGPDGEGPGVGPGAPA
jgi:hypothetical protein